MLIKGAAEDINIDTEWKIRHLDIQIALVHLHKNQISICTESENVPLAFFPSLSCASENFDCWLMLSREKGSAKDNLFKGILVELLWFLGSPS